MVIFLETITVHSHDNVTLKLAAGEKSRLCCFGLKVKDSLFQILGFRVTFEINDFSFESRSAMIEFFC